MRSIVDQAKIVTIPDGLFFRWRRRPVEVRVTSLVVSGENRLPRCAVEGWMGAMRDEATIARSGQATHRICRRRSPVSRWSETVTFVDTTDAAEYRLEIR